MAAHNNVPSRLINRLRKETPSWNEDVCNGFAFNEMKRIPATLDKVMHCAFDGAVPGLRYVGQTRCDPKEHLAELTRQRHSKSQLEQTRASFVAYRYDFEYKGEPLPPRYIYVPYAERFGLFTLRDTKYVIMPRLDDYFFSVDNGNVFIPFTRLRITVLRDKYFFNDGSRTQPTDIYWSRIHHSSNKSEISKRKPQLLNYLMCWYGATEAFKYMGYEVVLGDEDTLNENDFPRDQWVVCESSGIRPKVRVDYQKPKTKIAIRKEQYDRTAMSLIGSFFYMLDNTADWPFMKAENMDNPVIWNRVLARCIWSTTDIRNAVNEVSNHLEAVEEYLDEIVLRKLRIQGLDITTIQELFRYIIKNFSFMTINNDPSRTVGKHFDVVDHVTFSAIKMINRVMYSLTRLDPAKVNISSVRTIFSRQFKSTIFFKLATPEHREVVVAESASDCMPYKITSMMERPTRTNEVKAGPNIDRVHLLHGQMLYVHSVRAITKSGPSGMSRVNPNILLGPNNEVLEHPDIKPHADEIEALK